MPGEFSDYARVAALDPATGHAAGAAGAAISEVAAERAFLTVMAWGFGWVGYSPFRVERVLHTIRDAAARLQGAARELADRRAGPGLLAANDLQMRGLQSAIGQAAGAAGHFRTCGPMISSVPRWFPIVPVRILPGGAAEIRPS
jgi:hypothetical protein